MTSELRPAVEVWEADRELAIVALRAWAEQIGSGYSCPAAAQTMLMAATILEADREAVRAEQAAELAKFKALAETLAGALEKIAPITVRDGPDYAEVYFADGKTHSTQAMTMNPQDWLDLSEALRQYKEATNV